MENLNDTPAHNRLSSTHPFTSTAQEYDPVFVVAAEEMKNKFFGPISINQFLEYYLPINNIAMPEWDPESFRHVASSSCSGETQMYDPMVRVDIILLSNNLKKSDFCT